MSGREASSLVDVSHWTANGDWARFSASRILSFSRVRIWWFAAPSTRAHFEGLVRFFEFVGGVKVLRTDAGGGTSRDGGCSWMFASSAAPRSSCRLRKAGQVERIRDVRNAFGVQVMGARGAWPSLPPISETPQGRSSKFPS